MKKSLLFNAFVYASIGTAAFGEEVSDAKISYSYFTGDESELTAFGLNQIASYDVAYPLNDANLIGATIEAIRFYVPSGASVDRASVWLSDTLQVKSYTNVPNISADTISTIQSGWNEVLLSSPYTITEKGVYVGYSINVPTLASAGDYTPIALVSDAEPDGFYLHASITYRRKWSNMYSYSYGNSSAQAIVSGGNIKDNSAAVKNIKNAKFAYRQDLKLPISVSNHGYNGVTSIDYSYSMGEISGTGHADFPATTDIYYGQTSTFTIDLPAQEESGLHTVNVTIDKVNGVDNPDADKSGVVEFNIISFIPKHRPLLEEYTGTWCGYCPRGYVGLQKMNELFPEDFIGVSYHNGDPMEITSDYPNNVTGFPSAFIDRYHQTDAYYGDNGNFFAIDKTWLEVCKIETSAEIAVSAVWADAEQTQLDVTSTVKFNIDQSDAPYKIAYFLLADSLCNNDPSSKDYGSWAQHNYYGGSTGDDDLKMFEEASSVIPGLAFNDIIIDASAIRGIAGSITAPIVNDVNQSYTYRYDIANAVNTKNENIVQDKSKLRVAAAIIETTTGKVVNAAKGVITNTTGMSNIESKDIHAQVSMEGDMLNIRTNSSNVVCAEVFSADGQLVARAISSKVLKMPIEGNGMFVVRISDGIKTTSSKFVK